MTKQRSQPLSMEARIRNIYDSMSAGQQKVAQLVMARGAEASYMSSAKLAELAGVSQPTVIRTAQALGFEGFSEFQTALQEWFLIGHINGADRFQLDLRTLTEEAKEQSQADEVAGFRRIMLADAAHIQTIAQQLPEAEFEQAADMLNRARRIYVVGFHHAEPFALAFGTALSAMRPDCYVVRPSFGDFPDRLAEIASKDDLLAAISFSRYERRTLQCMDYAHQAGARVLTITDSPLSPAARRAEVALVVPFHRQMFVVAAQLSLLNALTVAVAQRRQGATRARHESLDEIHRYFQTFERQDESNGDKPTLPGG